MTDGDRKRYENPEHDPVLFWLGVTVICLLAVVVHYLTHGARLPKVTAAAAVSEILLSEKVPPDDRIILLVRRRSGNQKFGRKALAWYKTKARQGKLRGQTGPHVIDQRIARYHVVGRFSGPEVQI